MTEMRIGSKEHYDMMDQFERSTHGRFDKEDKSLWPKGIIYQDGHINDLFIAYRRGYAFCEADMRSDIQNIEASRDGYRADARDLLDALTRMVSLYESECDHENTHQWRPDWLTAALARTNAAEGSPAMTTPDQPAAPVQQVMHLIEHYANMRHQHGAPEYNDVSARARQAVIAALSHPAPGAGQQEAVAYLDIGAGGYLDLGSDRSDDDLLKLPKGRHMLGIIGTYGVDGYKAAAPAAPAVEAVTDGEIDAAANDCFTAGNNLTRHQWRTFARAAIALALARKGVAK